MTKKILSLIQAIIQVVAAVFLFIPGVYSWDYYESQYGTKPFNRHRPDSAFEASSIASCEFSAYLLVILMAVATVYFAVYFASNISWISKKCMIAIPCLQIVGLVLNAIKVSDWKYSSGSYYSGLTGASYSISWVFYVICALVAIVILLELFKHFSKLPEKKATTKNSYQSATSQELNDLKALLDQGIITQEEFDAKKRQLLGL